MEFNIRHQKLKKNQYIDFVVFSQVEMASVVVQYSSKLMFQSKFTYLSFGKVIYIISRTDCLFKWSTYMQLCIHIYIYISIHIYIYKSIFCLVQHFQFCRLKGYYFFFCTFLSKLGYFSELKHRFLFQFHLCKKIQCYFPLLFASTFLFIMSTSYCFPYKLFSFSIGLKEQLYIYVKIKHKTRVHYISQPCGQEIMCSSSH